MSALARWLERFGQHRPAVPVRVVGRAALGHAHAVVVIDVDGRRFLVGIGPHGIAPLGRWPAEPRPTGAGDVEEGR